MSCLMKRDLFYLQGEKIQMEVKYGELESLFSLRIPAKQGKTSETPPTPIVETESLLENSESEPLVTLSPDDPILESPQIN